RLRQRARCLCRWQKRRLTRRMSLTLARACTLSVVCSRLRLLPRTKRKAWMHLLESASPTLST
ncbi:hypothetical protein GGH17_006366, partial [Coemansia sp. RSA 788]